MKTMARWKYRLIQAVFLLVSLVLFPVWIFGIVDAWILDDYTFGESVRILWPRRHKNKKKKKEKTEETGGRLGYRLRGDGVLLVIFAVGLLGTVAGILVYALVVTVKEAICGG